MRYGYGMDIGFQLGVFGVTWLTKIPRILVLAAEPGLRLDVNGLNISRKAWFGFLSN